ncbi:hypothetical protein DPMN_184100 [Dreissena polymorpha]|uniref:Uncharacterized protein n=1 Tax=Dreissena polymorpha TaxID=45954 RepID=A0A9D4DL47_DREPO|nr:hypothetical protein DPMN_184100 [Dreissena polymorpha]
MYKLVPMNRTGRSSPSYVMPLQMSHPVDEDHTHEVGRQTILRVVFSVVEKQRTICDSSQEVYGKTYFSLV